ncbi:LiaI-LiaF-like domain-containing protein [Metabacillus sp. 84]|uniref:LiaI-LiaF-like domain-containing protein n=1 Tax=unclassified Metabacillus TaxID=2675274 RepID=UPI003CEC6D1A
MKQRPAFPAYFLIIIGAYFLFQKLNIVLFPEQNSWPTLVLLFGAVFLISSFTAKDDAYLVPGLILAGLGVHFLMSGKNPSWPDDAAGITIIIGIALLIASIKAKNGYITGAIVLLAGLFLHYFEQITGSFSQLEEGISYAEKFWPFLFIAAGLFLLFRKK